MSLSVLKDNRFYSLWPMKAAGVGDVRKMYEKMGYVVTMKDRSMHITKQCLKNDDRGLDEAPF